MDEGNAMTKKDVWGNVVSTNTAGAGVNIDDLLRLVKEAEGRRATLDTDFVFTAEAWQMTKAAMPVYEDTSVMLDSLCGVPVYVYATEAECRAKAVELRDDGRRPKVVTADDLRGADTPLVVPAG